MPLSSDEVHNFFETLDRAIPRHDLTALIELYHREATRGALAYSQELVICIHFPQLVFNLFEPL